MPWGGRRRVSTPRARQTSMWSSILRSRRRRAALQCYWVVSATRSSLSSLTLTGTVSAVKVDIGAFRTFLELHAAVSGRRSGRVSVLGTVEDFGVHAGRYYQLENNYSDVHDSQNLAATKLKEVKRMWWVDRPNAYNGAQNSGPKKSSSSLFLQAFYITQGRQLEQREVQLENRHVVTWLSTMPPRRATSRVLPGGALETVFQLEDPNAPPTGEDNLGADEPVVTPRRTRRPAAPRATDSNSSAREATQPQHPVNREPDKLTIPFRQIIPTCVGIWYEVVRPSTTSPLLPKYQGSTSLTTKNISAPRRLRALLKPPQVLLFPKLPLLQGDAILEGPREQGPTVQPEHPLQHGKEGALVQQALASPQQAIFGLFFSEMEQRNHCIFCQYAFYSVRVIQS
ncbi:hypothetical protein B0H14DRAFT_2603713 [Mycena olivaceomarginata]|nr:hypothetical protein B0H14DRAFT_2603713 [Mycena olivaceomarginata]